MILMIQLFTTRSDGLGLGLGLETWSMGVSKWIYVVVNVMQMLVEILYTDGKFDLKRLQLHYSQQLAVRVYVP